MKVGSVAREIRDMLSRMGQDCNQYGHTSDCVHRVGLAVACMAARGMTDGNEAPKAQEMAERILKFVGDAGIEATLDAGEMQLLKAPAGSWSESERNQASWLIEGVSVLAWALGRTQLPPFETLCGAAAVTLELGLFRPETREQIGTFETRDQIDYATWAAHYFALHYRFHHYFVNPEKMDFDGMLRDKWPPLVRQGLDLRDGDLILDGLALNAVPQPRLREVFGIVRERCKAFRWLTGYDKSYATVTRVQ